MRQGVPDVIVHEEERKGVRRVAHLLAASPRLQKGFAIATTSPGLGGDAAGEGESVAEPLLVGHDPLHLDRVVSASRISGCARMGVLP
jgi:hypothetical protein